MEAFQAEVAWTALAAIGGQGFALAGAGALIAHGLVDRLTEDLDLFSPQPGGAAHVTARLQQALQDAGFVVTFDSSDTVTGGDFARLEVSRGDRSVQIDLGRDWRQHPPVLLAVGPVLHPDDAVGNKVCAMISRGLPRDYLDVAAALRRYDRTQLLELGFRRDPGLRVLDVALAMRTLDQLPDTDFGDYHRTPQQTAATRRAFADWPRDPAHDPRPARRTSPHPRPAAPAAVSAGSPGSAGCSRQPPAAARRTARTTRADCRPVSSTAGRAHPRPAAVAPRRPTVTPDQLRPEGGIMRACSRWSGRAGHCGPSSWFRTCTSCTAP